MYDIYIFIIIITFILIIYFYRKRDYNILKDTHMRCPCNDKMKTNIISFIYYEPLNELFILSLSNRECIRDIQTSLYNRDNRYNIKYDIDNYYLFNNNQKKQRLIVYNDNNLNLIKDITNNKIMK